MTEESIQGYLKFCVEPAVGDRLILSPTYVFPVEILERGLMTRLSYTRNLVLVDGCSGSASMCERIEALPLCSLDLSSFEAEKLPLKIPCAAAAELAEFGALPSNYRSWRKIMRHRNIMVSAKEVKLLWHVYAIRGNEVTDTFSGEKTTSAALVGMLFKTGGL